MSNEEKTPAMLTVAELHEKYDLIRSPFCPQHLYDGYLWKPLIAEDRFLSTLVAEVGCTIPEERELFTLVQNADGSVSVMEGIVSKNRIGLFLSYKPR